VVGVSQGIVTKDSGTSHSGTLVPPRFPQNWINSDNSVAPPVAPGARVVPPDCPDSPAEARRRRRRQLSHDIHHELGTIMMLASLLATSPDVGPDSKQRARQILGETRWLDQLQRAYEDCALEPDNTAPEPVGILALDAVAREVVAAMSLSTATAITVTARPTHARADRLAFWRAVRNLIDNAVRAAGPAGHVEVTLYDEDGWAVVQVDDDGPGFGAAKPGLGSLGLGIVQDMTGAWGGHLQIRHRSRGGASVRMLLPESPPGPL